MERRIALAAIAITVAVQPLAAHADMNDIYMSDNDISIEMGATPRWSGMVSTSSALPC